METRQYVCFDCRTTASRSCYTPKGPRCPKCRKDLTCLQRTSNVPKKRDDKGWKGLRDYYLEQVRRSRLRREALERHYAAQEP